MTEPHEPQNPAANQDATQTGLPASRWYWWHTAGLAFFVVLIVGVALRRPMELRDAWLVLAASLMAFAAISGHGIKGVWRGVFIDERNMISLSRLQMLVWTVVVLSAYGTMALARVQETPATALDVAVPDTLWLLIGISTTSLVGSPLLKNTKRGKGSALEEQEKKEILENQRKDLSKRVRAEGRIASKKSVDDASWSICSGFVPRARRSPTWRISTWRRSRCSSLPFSLCSRMWSRCGPCLRTARFRKLSRSARRSPRHCPVWAMVPLTLLTISHGGYLVNKAVPAKAP